MGKFKNDVTQIQKEAGGFKKAEKRALAVFNEGKRSALNRNIESRNNFLEKGFLTLPIP